MNRIDPSDLKHIETALREYPANGQLDMNNKGHTFLLMHGLVEHRETKKRCQACGHERPDHSWHAISPAGRLVMAVMGIEHA